MMRYTPQETTTNVICRAARLRAAGHITGAIQVLRDALDAREHGGDADRALLMRELGECYLSAGAWNDAQQSLDAGAALVEGKPEFDAVHAAIQERKAFAFFRQSRLDEAKETASAVRKQLMPQPDAADPATLAGAHNTLGGVAWQQGNIDEATHHVKLAADFYDHAGDRIGSANARTNLGILLASGGSWTDAQQQFIESERIRRSEKYETGRASNLLNLGLLELSMGDHKAAREHLTESHRLSIDYGQNYDAAHAEIALAQLDLIEAKVDDALRNLDDVLSRTDCICDDDKVQAAWLRSLIECDRSSPDRAVEIAAEARQIAQKSRLIESEADCCRALAFAHRRSRRFDEAERALAEAISLAETIGDPYRRALAMLDLGAVCNECGDRSKTATARTNFDEAEKIFRQLGARYDLGRVKTLRESMDA